jgi:hypothetical protein
LHAALDPTPVPLLDAFDPGQGGDYRIAVLVGGLDRINVHDEYLQIKILLV